MMRHFRRLRLTGCILAGGLVCLFGPMLSAPAQEGDLKAVREAEAKRVQLIERLSKTVVAIFPDGSTRGGGSGSGVIIDKDGHALTNYHVVGDAKTVNVGLSNGRVYPATVKGRDTTGDIAVIQIKGGPFEFAALGDSDTLRQGDWVLAMGNPFGLATDFMPTVTQGVVSGLHRFLPGTIGGDLIYTDSIQVDAPINPGNSGGPLFNDKGELVGINGRVSARPSRGRVNTGVGFAIPINQIKGFLPGLIKGELVHHAVLGVELSEGSGDVSITRVVQGMSAQKAGLRVGDIVRSFQSREIRSEIELINRIGVLPEGTRVKLVIERDKRRYPIEVVLDKRPTSSERATVVSGRGTPATTKDTVPVGLTAAGIAGRYAEAVGGYEALAKIRDTVTVGTLRRQMANGSTVTGTITQYDVASNQLRHEIQLRAARAVVRQVSVFDGVGGWNWTNGTLDEMDDKEVAAIRSILMEFDELTKPDAWNSARARYVGTEPLDGRTLVVVVTTDAAGVERRWSFDPETWYLVRYRYKSSATDTERDNRLSDYRPVGGVMQPFTFALHVDGRLSETIEVQSIQFNLGIRQSFLRERPPSTIGPKVF